MNKQRNLQMSSRIHLAETPSKILLGTGLFAPSGFYVPGNTHCKSTTFLNHLSHSFLIGTNYLEVNWSIKLGQGWNMLYFIFAAELHSILWIRKNRRLIEPSFLLLYRSSWLLKSINHQNLTLFSSIFPWKLASTVLLSSCVCCKTLPVTARNRQQFLTIFFLISSFWAKALVVRLPHCHKQLLHYICYT